MWREKTFESVVEEADNSLIKKVVRSANQVMIDFLNEKRIKQFQVMDTYVLGSQHNIIGLESRCTIVYYDSSQNHLRKI